MDLVLRPFTLADEADAWEAHRELAADDFSFLLEDADSFGSWPDYVSRLGEVARGENLAADRVPMHLLAAVVGGELVGRTSVRSPLTEGLHRFGGHIGYGVRPAFRRRGYATEILRQSLGIAARMGVESALVVCDQDNVGSFGAIEACGGVLEGVAPGPEGRAMIRRYWVPTG